ncbi:MAG: hypothetical protein RR931_06795 [Mucinivorans sp.]
MDISTAAKVTLSYANETIFLFMGGFMIALVYAASIEGVATLIGTPPTNSDSFWL